MRFMNKDETRKILDRDLIDVAKIWQHQLRLEYMNPKRNVRVSFSDLGPCGELLAISYNMGYTGSGSGGMGLDLVNRNKSKSVEVKSCCTIQSSKCTEETCGAKFSPLFHAKCPICGALGKTMTDSRFSINSKEFLEQYNKGFFDNFTLCHVYQIGHDEEKKSLAVAMDWYRIDFKDKDTREIKLEYFRRQAEDGSKPTCNLLPRSYDFFKLCPVLLDTIHIDINYRCMLNAPKIRHLPIELIREATKVREGGLRLSDPEKEMFRSLETYDAESGEVDMKDFALNMPYRKKSHGKERGDTRKGAYRAAGLISNSLE